MTSSNSLFCGYEVMMSNLLGNYDRGGSRGVMGGQMTPPQPENDGKLQKN